MNIACFSLIAVLAICTLAAAQSPDEIVRSPKVRMALWQGMHSVGESFDMTDSYRGTQRVLLALLAVAGTK